jgi:hypothetical protein
VNYIAITATFALVAISMDGCRQSNAICPQTPIVVEPTKAEFGFVGTWKELPEPNNPDMEHDEEFSISRDEDGVYRFENKNSDKDDAGITIRATELEKGSAYAIVEIDVVASRKHFCRFLALATRKDDELFLWWIESKNIAAKLHDSGHSGVVEHGTFSTRVYATPEALLDCIRKHSRELVGEPKRFKLVFK